MFTYKNTQWPAFVCLSIKHAPTWIGLSDIHMEGRWMWSDGSVVRFFNWLAGEPNNLEKNEHCVQNNFGPVKKWNDEPCSRGYPSVCVKRNACA
ncbi:C-type lectin lectoxin-Enh6-like [Maylandia zebra]|uniref:C-type lectin lectoxin-Enh6-like n=1 Tax=Maylandia zebra TaxID=106582 RepID=UPI00403C5CE7